MSAWAAGSPACTCAPRHRLPSSGARQQTPCAILTSQDAGVQVQYRWEHTPGVDAAAALYLALVVGLGAFVAVTAGVLASYDSKLRAFMADLAGEDGLVVPGKDE